jgi:hypothetical protein
LLARRVISNPLQLSYDRIAEFQTKMSAVANRRLHPPTTTKSTELRPGVGQCLAFAKTVDRLGQHLQASSGRLGVLDGSGRTMFYAFTISAGLLGVAEASFWTMIVGLGRHRGGSLRA